MAGLGGRAPPPEELSMQEVEDIVRALNGPPFRKGLTMVAFDELGAQQLLQLTNDVLAHLDEKQRVDVRDEQQAVTAARMTEFVLLLGYPHASSMDLKEFSDALLRADRAVLYPLLSFLLSQLPELKTRAYLGRFLRNLEIPEEFFADADLVQHYETYKARQQVFKDVHQALETARRERLDPDELRREIAQLETEKEQLSNKLGRLRERVRADSEFQQVPFDELLGAVRALRNEQEMETKLEEQLHEQQEQYYRSESRCKAVTQQLEEFDASDVARDPMELLHMLRQEVQQQAKRLGEELPAQIRQQEDVLEDLERAMSGRPFTYEDIDEMDAEAQQLEREIAALAAERDRLQASADDQIGFFRDRAIATENKRDRLREELAELEDEQREAEVELRKANVSLSGVGGGVAPVKESDIKAYMKELKQKTEQYKECKAEATVLANELGVLQHTMEVLRESVTNVEQLNRELEEQRGVVGAMSTQDTLESVSAQKSSIDKQSGSMLDDMAATIKHIVHTVKQMKSRLAPQIKELRELRQAHKQVETEHATRTKEYNNMVLALDSERLQLEQQLHANENGFMAEESSYHFLNCLATITQAKVTMMQQQEFAERGDAKEPNYEQLYLHTIREYEGAAKRLRKEKKDIKDTHRHRVAQRSLFKDVERLLEAKAAIQEREEAQRAEDELNEHEAYLADPAGGAGANVMSFD